MINMFKFISSDINHMIELSQEIGCLETEYLYISNIKDKYNYNKEKAELVRTKLHETILELDKLQNKYTKNNKKSSLNF